MTDVEHALELVRKVAADLVPELTERLERHGLAEIEVARGEVRLRVASSTGPPGTTSSADAGAILMPEAPTEDATTTPANPSGRPAEPASLGIAAPAVGYFVYADGLGPGLAVTKGDAIGHVEMLGVRHDVRAPRGGTVRHLVAESGEAVEYGQVVVEIEPGDAR
jgi:acetyl-CoA carboxylase biotin carboxyl carrier protein